MKIKKACYGCKKKYVIAEMKDGVVARVVKTKSYSFCQVCTESKVKDTK
jgi:hypothetical protein